MKEKVFIAWGGNQELALSLGDKLSSMGYIPIVGGGSPESLFIGNQVLNQINRSSRAIILVGKIKNKIESLPFSYNLMFEWGYITAKLPPQKIHVFLIDMVAKDLPSDLAGSWAKEISAEEKTIASLAEEIAINFHNNNVKTDTPNKLDIFSRWKEIKMMLDKHNSSPLCSDREMSHYILHSIQSAFYHSELPLLKEKLTNLSITSEQFGTLVQLAKSVINIFLDTEMLTKPLSFDVFFEEKTVFTSILKSLGNDTDLDRWQKIIAADKLGLGYIFLAKNDELSLKEKENCYAMAKEYDEEERKLIQLNNEINPQDTVFSGLYLSYIYRNRANMFLENEQIDEAREMLEKSIEQREMLFLNYKQNYPYDLILVSRFSQEYYLALIEKIKYSSDSTEKMLIKRTVEKYMKSWEEEFNKQHLLMKLLHSAFDQLKSSL